MRRAVAWIVASTAAACSSPRVVVDTTVPEGTDRVAVIAENSGGTLVFATAIQVVTPGTATTLETGDAVLEGSFVSVLGWSSTQLSGLAVDAQSLRHAGSGEASLPVPSFAVGGLVIDALVTPSALRSDQLPRLSSGSLATCPQRVDSDAIIDSSCAATNCFGHLQQSGCMLSMELLSCGLGKARGLVDSAGVATIDATPLIGPCVEEEVEGTALALRCQREGRDSCRVDAIDPDRAVESFGSVKRVQLVMPTQSSSIGRGTVLAGYLGAMVAFDDHLLVVGTRERRSDVWCTDRESTLMVVDAETLAVESATTTYPCLTAMVRDPYSDGVLAAFGGPQAARLARFDRRGRLLASSPIDTGGLSVSRLATAPRNGLVYAALSTSRRGRGELRAIDARTGVEAWRAIDGGDRYLDIQASDDQVVVLDEGGGYVLAFGAIDGSFRFGAPIGLACGIQGTNPVRVWPLRNPSRWVVTSARDAAEVLVLSSALQGGCESASFYAAADADPLAIAPYPGDDGERLMVGLWTPSGDAVLARVDARSNRFLPGMVLLGRGHVGELVSIGERIFATLPQTGELVRVDP